MPSAAKVMIWLPAPMVIAKPCVALGLMPLAALITATNAPNALGIPLIMPVPTLRVSPGGRPPAITEKVGDGAPLAVTANV